MLSYQIDILNLPCNRIKIKEKLLTNLLFDFSFSLPFFILILLCVLCNCRKEAWQFLINLFVKSLKIKRMQNESVGADGRTKNRANRKCYLTSQKKINRKTKQN